MNPASSTLTGAEPAGTGSQRWRGMAAGSRKADGSFRLLLAEPVPPTTAFLSAAGTATTLPDWIRT